MLYPIYLESGSGKPEKSLPWFFDTLSLSPIFLVSVECMGQPNSWEEPWKIIDTFHVIYLERKSWGFFKDTVLKIAVGLRRFLRFLSFGGFRRFSFLFIYILSPSSPPLAALFPKVSATRCMRSFLYSVFSRSLLWHVGWCALSLLWIIDAGVRDVDLISKISGAKTYSRWSDFKNLWRENVFSLFYCSRHAYYEHTY